MFNAAYDFISDFLEASADGFPFFLLVESSVLSDLVGTLLFSSIDLGLRESDILISLTSCLVKCVLQLLLPERDNIFYAEQPRFIDERIPGFVTVANVE